MRTKTWIRFTLASAIFTVGGLGVLAAGCSDDDTSDGDAGPDANDDRVVPPIDAQPDVKPPTDGGPVAYPRIALVHAAPGLGPVKFCIGTSPTSFPIPTPLPEGNTAIPFGAGGFLPLADAIAAVIPTVDLYPVAIPANEITAGKTCADLAALPDAGGAPNAVHYPKVLAGTLKANKSYLVVAQGCGVGGAAVGIAPRSIKSECGDDWTIEKGNNSLTVIEIDRTAPAANEVGLQFLHQSPALSAVFGLKQGGPTGFTPAMSWLRDAATEDAADATAISDEAFITAAAGISYVVDGGATTLVKSTRVATNLPNPSLGFNGYPLTLNGDAGADASIFVGSNDAGTGIPLTMIPYFSYAAPVAAATQVKAGTNYTFIAVGDPTIPYDQNVDAGTIGYLGLRVVVFPNDPIKPATP